MLRAHAPGLWRALGAALRFLAPPAGAPEPLARIRSCRQRHLPVSGHLRVRGQIADGVEEVSGGAILRGRRHSRLLGDLIAFAAAIAHGLKSVCVAVLRLVQHRKGV